MSRKIVSLAIAALDEFSRIVTLQELLKICLEQLDEQNEKTYTRIDLLLTCYQSELDLRLDELKVHLERIRKVGIDE